MKIVTVLTTGSAGGAEFAAVEMLAALRERGHEVVMLSNQSAITRESGIPLRLIDTGPKMASRSWPGLLLKTPRHLWTLRRALKAEMPYDVLLLHYKKEQVWSLLLDPALTRTTVWSEWGPVPFPLRSGLPLRLYRLAAHRAKAIMAVSPGTVASVAERGIPRTKIEYVPNVLRTDDVDFTAEGRADLRRALGIPEEAFVVGTISRFNRKKRNDVVVDAVKLLGDDSGAHVILAGEGEMEDDLRARAESLGDRAHFIPTPMGNVADVLSAFDVLVFCPSPTEGAPRAVILGMLARRAVLATGPEGVADMIRPEFGAITSDRINDPEALAELLRPYLADPDLARRQGEAARAHAEATYAAPVVAAQIEDIFKSAMNGASA